MAFSILADRELKYAAPSTAAKSSERSPRTGSWPVMAFARRHLFVLWSVWALGCVVAMFLRPAEPTIPYQLGWAGCAIVFGLGTWGRWRLVSALSWYTLVSGAALERSWKLGVIGWDETSAIPLMLLLALMIGWHAYRRQIALEVVTRLAATDSLTGLANRATFNSTLSDALEDQSSPNTTVLFVDLDDFKGINDVFGHRAGDDLLREVGARLVRVTRPGDLCTRLGGDEFAVMLRDTGSEEAEHVARRIVEAIADTMLIGGRVTHVGASVGVATATGECDLESLIHCADVAMYRGQGEGQVPHPGLRARPAGPRHLPRGLRAGADRRRRQQRARRPLPARAVPAGRALHRRGGPGPVATPRARPAPPRLLHPDRREDRRHRPHRHLRSATGLRRRVNLERCTPWLPHGRTRQHLRATAGRRRLHRHRHQLPSRVHPGPRSSCWRSPKAW